MSAFVVSQIKPSLNIDSSQRFIFGLEGAPEPLGSLKIDNIYVPLAGSPSVTHFDLRNNALSGFRLRQETALGDTHGTLKIQSFLNGSNTGTDLMTFKEDGTIEFNGTVNATLTLTGAVTGSGTGTINTTLTDITTSQISDFAASVVSFRLDQFSLPANEIDLNNQKITNLSAIEFANTSLDTKIRFFTNNTPDNSFDQSGIGYIDAFGTIYHCPIGKSHRFYGGANGNMAVEINAFRMIVSGSGLYADDFRKVVFREEADNPHQVYGIGLKFNGLPTNYKELRTQLASSTGSFTWNYGVDSGTSRELMRLDQANGLVVKNQVPATVGNDSYTDFKLENSASGGYRFRHRSFSGNPAVGQLSLQVMNGSGDALDIFNIGFSTLSLPGFGGERYTIFGAFETNASQATLGVNEGKNNVLNEASCLRVVSATNAAKIEIQNTAASGRLYEFRSNSDGSCSIFDRTTGVLRLSIAAAGGLENITSLNFTNDFIQKKVVFRDTAGNDHQYYGIGMLATSELRYQAGQGGYHMFWIGTSPSTSYCGMSINPSGNIGLGNYQNATLSRLFIKGGPTLDGVGEESVIRAENADLLSTTVKIQLVHVNAKNWELRSNSDGSFQIYDKFALTSRYLLSAAGASTFNGSLTAASDLTTNGNLRVDGTGSIGGNMGVGITSPTLAKLQVEGGVQNVVGEDTAIRAISALSSVKIELQNTAAGGKVYELRSTSTGQFDIVDRTGSASRLAITTSGDVGVNMGLSTINAQLQLPNVLRNRQLVLWSAANNNFQFHGFGSTSGGLRYSINGTGDSHIFVAGVNTTTANEVGRITGTGDLVMPGTIYGRRPSGMLSMEGNAIATALTANVWAKVLGITTASGFLNQFSSPVSNRLTCTSTSQIVGLIYATITLNFTAGGGGTVRSIAIFKNGLQISPSLVSEDAPSGSNITLTTHTFTSLSLNDFIEVYVRSSANSNVTASSMMLTVIAS